LLKIRNPCRRGSAANGRGLLAQDPKPLPSLNFGNLWERRTRLKKRFEVYKNFRQDPCPDSYSKESWWKIHKDSIDEKKRSKAALYKVAAEKKIQAIMFTHKCGPKGLKGLCDRFVRLLPFSSLEFACFGCLILICLQIP
jgi:hypothetical protein